MGQQLEPKHWKSEIVGWREDVRALSLGFDASEGQFGHIEVFISEYFILKLFGFQNGRVHPPFPQSIQLLLNFLTAGETISLIIELIFFNLLLRASFLHTFVFVQTGQYDILLLGQFFLL